MILEIADIEIKPGHEKDFEAAVAKAQPIFAQAHGFIDLTLRRNIEHPSLYHLCINWQTLEDHTVKFRGSEGFHAWRQLALPHFAKLPAVSHNAVVTLDRAV